MPSPRHTDGRPGRLESRRDPDGTECGHEGRGAVDAAFDQPGNLGRICGGSDAISSVPRPSRAQAEALTGSFHPDSWPAPRGQDVPELVQTRLAASTSDLSPAAAMHDLDGPTTFLLAL
jgi:hypothetical protein